MPREMVAEMRGTPVWPGFEAVAHTLVYDTILMDGQDAHHAARTDDHRAGAAPRRRASPPWAAAAVDGLAELLPHAERRTLAGQTHDVAADALAPALSDFFSATVRV